MNSKTSCPGGKYQSFTALLQAAGLRPTRQRVALAKKLFNGRFRHITADQLYATAAGSQHHISLATVYNTLNGFVRAGLLRQVSMDGGQTFFDTNTEIHYHFFDEKTRRLEDVPVSAVRFARLPRPQKGKVVSCVDVVIRIKAVR